ncbi:hypothetical protein [Embleya sp. NPDC020630]|uniref:hypothetical protein n=1 Tax=Embleya sp. NPDC020630 TaxID=3363979 RepID=UPI0037975981
MSRLLPAVQQRKQLVSDDDEFPGQLPQRGVYVSVREARDLPLPEKLSSHSSTLVPSIELTKAPDTLAASSATTWRP